MKIGSLDSFKHTIDAYLSPPFLFCSEEGLARCAAVKRDLEDRIRALQDMLALVDDQASLIQGAYQRNVLTLKQEYEAASAQSADMVTAHKSRMLQHLAKQFPAKQ
jgi:hypothetical protein